MVQETNCLTLTPSVDSCPENYAHFTVWPRWANNPRESGGTTTAMSTVWPTTSTHLVKDIYWPGTSGNLRSFSSSMLVAKVKWEEPVTIARPVPYGEWNTLASSTWFWTTSCEQNNQHCTNQLSLAVDGSPVQQTDSWTDKERKKERCLLTLLQLIPTNSVTPWTVFPVFWMCLPRRCFRLSLPSLLDPVQPRLPRAAASFSPSSSFPFV